MYTRRGMINVHKKYTRRGMINVHKKGHDQCTQEGA